MKADFKVPTLVAQKLINKKEVSPISSQPMKSRARLPAKTSMIILITNEFINSSKRSTFGSYLKYEKAYRLTKTAMVVVRRAKLKETRSR